MEDKRLVTSTTEDHVLVLDDGRIESIGEFLSPEQLYQDMIDRRPNCRLKDQSI